MEFLDQFLSDWKSLKSIEVVADFYAHDSQQIFREGPELALTKTAYKKLIEYSFLNVEKDTPNSTLVACLLGSHDDRFFMLRNKSNFELPLKEEIQICHIGLTSNPKCTGAFSRLKMLLNENKDHSEIKNIITEEIQFCNMLLEKRERNYNLWSHRSWIYDNFTSLLAEEEYKWAENYAYSHPSDYSCYSYLQHIMPKDLQTLCNQLRTNTRMIFEYPGHESLWNHRKFILASLKEYKKSDKEVNVNETIQERLSKLQFPEIIISSRINPLLEKICTIYNITMNLLPFFELPSQSQEENKEQLLKWIDSILSSKEPEDMIVQVAISDTFPTEHEKQKSSAQKYFKWLHLFY